MSQKAARRTPETAKEASKSAQEAPQRGPEVAKSGQEAPKTLQKSRLEILQKEIFQICGLHCPRVRFRWLRDRFFFVFCLARKVVDTRFVLVFPIQNASPAVFALHVCVHEQACKNIALGAPKLVPEARKTRSGRAKSAPRCTTNQPRATRKAARREKSGQEAAKCEKYRQEGS